MTFDPDAPWWVNVVLLLLIATITSVGGAAATWLLTKRGRRTEHAELAGKLEKVATDARTAADQTANAHADAEFPNLRDELTAARASATAAQSNAEQAAADARAARESAHRTERFVTDLAETIRAAEHSQDRRHKQNVDAIDQVREDLEEHIAKEPELVAAAVREAEADHIKNCPQRGGTSPSD